MNNPLDLWRGNWMSPFRDTQFQRAIDRLFDDWARPMKGEMQNYAFNPSCEINETKNNYMVKFDLPGVSKDQIKIDLHDNQLTVSGERKEERKEDDKDKRRHFTECYYGSFTRAFTFPTPVDPERVEAKFENGVLTVNVAKTEATKARQINIK